MGRNEAEGRGVVGPKRKPKNMFVFVITRHGLILLVSQAFGGPFMKALNRIRF
jgi:hypothetical protein